jgi:tetraacyldisaccharide 4'-kinase
MRTLSQVFAAGVALRNGLYDCGVFKARRLSRPVVSVGNISVGGSGKTPFVIALGELLKERGIAFDVLSRGYGRRSATIALVDANGSPKLFGDEPLLIARTLRVPVIVGGDRYQAGVLAEKTVNGELHLLDDGFQHRKLHRDFDIVMLPAADVQAVLLPLGRLREPLSALRRADAVAVSDEGAPEEVARQWLRTPENVWRVQRNLELDRPERRVVAFCGIARPAQFFEQLRSLQLELAITIAFSDHHRYTGSDMARLLQARSASRAGGFITTEKDLINLGSLAEQLQPVSAAKLRLRLDGETVARTLLETLEGRCGCRF